jgi:hypothetical protein
VLASLFWLKIYSHSCRDGYLEKESNYWKVTSKTLETSLLRVFELPVYKDTIFLIDDKDKVRESSFDGEVFYKFSKNNCIECIKRDLAIIRKHPNVIIISDLTSKADLVRYKSLLNIQSGVYRTYNWSFNHLDNLNYPYYFKKTKQQLEYFFITDQGYEHVTDAYLIRMTKK